MTERKRGFYLPWIDGLRAIAALSVVVHHGPTLTAPAFSGLKNFLGWFGVDLFLVLSSFLLSRLLFLEHRETGEISIKNFFVRRALRIWPLYFVFVTMALMFGIDTHAMSLKDLMGWYLAHLTFTQNFAASIHSYSPFPFTGHLWTIALEEQAYLVIPIGLSVFFARAKRSDMIKGIVIAMTLFAIMRVSVVLLGRVHPYIWVLPLRADTFLPGVLLGVCTSVGATQKTQKKTFPAMLAAAVIAIGGTFFIGAPGLSDVGEVLGYPLMACACVFIVCCIDQSAALQWALGAPAMRHLGKISYGIYVFHLFALQQAERVAAHFDLASPSLRLALGVAFTMLLAEISYQLLERPFLLLKTRFTVIQNRPA